MEEKIYQILENNGVPKHLHEHIAKGGGSFTGAADDSAAEALQPNVFFKL